MRLAFLLCFSLLSFGQTLPIGSVYTAVASSPPALLPGAHVAISAAGTTSGINDVSATLLVANLPTYSGSSPATIADLCNGVACSPANTWVPLTNCPGANTQLRLWYVLNPTTSTVHTFLIGGSFASGGVAAFTGSFTGFTGIQNCGNDGTGTVQTGSVTTVSPNSLIVVGGAAYFNQGVGFSIDSGFNSNITDSWGGGAGWLGTFSFLVAPTVTTVNPTISNVGPSYLGGVIAVFH